MRTSLILSLGSLICVASLVGCGGADENVSSPDAPAAAAPTSGVVAATPGLGVPPVAGAHSDGDEGTTDALDNPAPAGTVSTAGFVPGVTGKPQGGRAILGLPATGAAGQAGAAGSGQAGSSAAGQGGASGSSGQAGAAGQAGQGGASGGSGQAGQAGAGFGSSPPVCEEGTTNGCFSVGHRSVCHGGFWAAETCPVEAPYCMMGGCVQLCDGQPCCQAGERRCGGDGPEVCAAGGKWVPAAPCSEGAAVCVDGACVQPTQLSLGKTASCALVEGRGYCWGQVQIDDLNVASTPKPALVEGLETLSQIAVGDYHACAVEAGLVKCWGSNTAGQLGRPSDAAWMSPVLPAVQRVAVGRWFTCAATEGGQVYCWGERPGEAAADASMEPHLVPGVDASRGLVAGALHVCASGKGGVVCWGNGSSGQVGQASGYVSADMPVVAGLGSANELFAGPFATCARGDEGMLCWGAIPGAPVTTTPTKLEAPANAVKMTMGQGFLCAMTAAGQVSCRREASAAMAEAGDGVFAPVELGGQAVDLAAGEGHACALLLDGQIKCWGANESGQLGVGLTEGPMPPSALVW